MLTQHELDARKNNREFDAHADECILKWQNHAWVSDELSTPGLSKMCTWYDSAMRHAKKDSTPEFDYLFSEIFTKYSEQSHVRAMSHPVLLTDTGVVITARVEKLLDVPYNSFFFENLRTLRDIISLPIEKLLTAPGTHYVYIPLAINVYPVYEASAFRPVEGNAHRIMIATRLATRND